MSTAEVLPELCPLARACVVTGQSKTYIYAHMKDAADPFPKPIQIGGRVYWLLPDLIAWNLRKVREHRARMGSWVGMQGPDTENP